MKKPKCTIKILDEVRVAVIGLDKNEYDFLYEKYGMFIKGHFFNPKVKLGRWDGKLRFFSKTGLTYVNLLEELLPAIKQMGYSFRLIDKRSGVTLNIPKIDDQYWSDYGVTLGAHQLEAINTITTYHSGIVEAGTGAGKSYINTILCDLYNKHHGFKTITIVPTVDLIAQTKADFAKFGMDVGEFSGTTKDLNHDHVISTWQTIQNDLSIMGLFQMVICDEAHLATGASLQKILNENGHHIIVRIGLTGTVPKHETDAFTVRMTLGDVRYIVKAHELIALGWLAALQVRVYTLKETFHREWAAFKENHPRVAAKITKKEFVNSIFPDYAAERKFLEGKVERNELIASLVEDRRRRKNGNCFILVNSIKHGNALKKLIPDSHFVSGSDQSAIRKEIYDMFKTKNDVVVIASYKLASTGLNIPRIYHLFIVDAGKGFIKLIQSIGRGLRKAEDKDSIEVIDIASDLKYAARHKAERLKYYRSENYNHTKKDVDYDTDV